MLGTIILIVVEALLISVLALWLVGERWRPLRPSTWKFLRTAGLRRVLNLGALHAYVHARWY